MTEPALPRTIGKYEVLSVLGKGGMGVVYKARDTIIDRIVAIKTILSKDHADDQQLLARLRMEAKSAGRLQHPNIVTIYDFGQQDEITYLVMEYVEGTNLSRLINSGVELPLNTKIDMVVRLCEGLAYAHDLGVVHRDIKPSNICVTKRFDPKILDFGLARFDETRLTKTGLVSGTISYMSPERLTGESGPSDDIFALGAVSYEIFTSQSAFPGKTMAEIVTNIRSGHFPVPPSQVADLPKELDAIIARATHPDKAKRYTSASDFARALRDLQHSATFQRRVTNDTKSSDAALHTVAMQLAIENPYTAPDISASKVAGKKVSDVHRVNTQIDQPSPAAEMPAVDTSLHTAERLIDKPTGAKISAAHFIPTEVMSKPVLTPPSSPGQEAPAASSPKTDEVPIPTTSRSVSGMTRLSGITRTVVDFARRRRDPALHVDAAEPPKSVVMKAVVQQAKKESPLRIALAAFALVVAIASIGIAAASGQVALLVAYAAAVAAWFFLVSEGEHVSLRTIAFIAFPLHILAL
ncbi:MAG TPA: protein kinase, partial [Thermoanaerobaculia bacterium]|nr:protein kinase [Thermoanaerobaculia bacterium]